MSLQQMHFAALFVLQTTNNLFSDEHQKNVL